MDNIIRMKNMSRRRFFKRAARRVLFSEWVSQILAFIIAGAFFVGVNHFGLSFASMLNEFTGNMYLSEFVAVLFSFVSLAFVIPILYGLVQFEINAVSGEKYSVSDVFGVFADADIVLRSYALFFSLLWRCVCAFLPALAVLFFKHTVNEFVTFESYYIGNVDLVVFAINTLVVVFVYLGVVLSSGFFVGIYISVKRQDLSVEECFYKAKNCISGSRIELVKTAVSFLPLFLLSLFSMGFLFVLYTVPYMFITFVMFSKYLYDKQNRIVITPNDDTENL